MKRFTVKTSAVVSNDFLYASLPQAIKAGYHKVDVYVPNPLRCYKCQRYGHEHEGFECKETPFCCNCKGSHIASPKESAICKLKVTNNISFSEARKLYFNKNKPTTSATANSYAAAANAPRSVASVACQTNLTWIDSSIPMQRPLSLLKPTRLAKQPQFQLFLSHRLMFILSQLQRLPVP